LSLIFDVIGVPRSGETQHIKNAQARKFLESQVRACLLAFLRAVVRDGRSIIVACYTIFIYSLTHLLPLTC